MSFRLLAAGTLTLAALASNNPATAQTGGITDTHNSNFAQMSGTPIGASRWTGGFWGEWFDALSTNGVKNMWATWQTDEAHGFENFLIASGEHEGEHQGPPFHDGDMYKWLEGVAAIYAVNKDPELDAIMDRFIGCVVKSQKANGYIHTPVVIAELNKKRKEAAEKASGTNTVIGTQTGTADEGAFGNRLNFETYNLGHLIMAGIVHKRATGKTSLFDAGVKAADFLIHFYETASDELARNAICPSHYMAIAELYRETGNVKYKELAQHFIDIRGKVENGTDDNQDRDPFRTQYNAMGHAVRANYLYAGVADLYLETGEDQLMRNLDAIWHDIVERKMYITGGCGALYDGTSPDGTNYTPDSIQKVHQSYGRPYQLPQSTAHNETCANIGNMLFNWRMLTATADAKYADVMETCLYNSIMSGISLDAKRYFYTNPLRLSASLPYTLRWPKERKEYISCFCCPPNTLRTLCETQNYAYSVGTHEARLFVNLYGNNTVATSLTGVGTLTVSQKSDYPWDGRAELTIDNLKGKKEFTMSMRIPGWCTGRINVSVNGEPMAVQASELGYCDIKRTWRKGDRITLEMPMEAVIVEANPLVEESRGQVAVMRGPVVYCAESLDLNGATIDNIGIPSDAKFTPVEMKIDGHRVMGLEVDVIVRETGSWKGKLYRPVETKNTTRRVKMIPYYAWGNRGKSEMSVWNDVVK